MRDGKRGIHFSKCDMPIRQTQSGCAHYWKLTKEKPTQFANKSNNINISTYIHIHTVHIFLPYLVTLYINEHARSMYVSWFFLYGMRIMNILYYRPPPSSWSYVFPACFIPLLLHAFPPYVCHGESVYIWKICVWIVCPYMYSGWEHVSIFWCIQSDGDDRGI